MLNTHPSSTNAGLRLIGMLFDAAQSSADELRDRVSQVSDAPLDIAIEQNCECIMFMFDGKPYLGALRGRNRNLCIDPSRPESVTNRAIAVRVLLDGCAIALQSPQSQLVD
jgi:hypothetical protein